MDSFSEHLYILQTASKGPLPGMIIDKYLNEENPACITITGKGLLPRIQ